MARNKKRRKSSKQKNINWGQGMAEFGNINATLGLVFAWIMMFSFIGLGLFLIIKGAEGKPISSLNGMCSPTDADAFGTNACEYTSETLCKGDNSCEWSNYGETKLSGGEKTAYIVGGFFTILLGISIVMIANWVRNKARNDQNFAAVIGTGALAEGIVGAFGGNR